MQVTACFAAADDSKKTIDSIVSLTENNFYFHNKDGAIKALASFMAMTHGLSTTDSQTQIVKGAMKRAGTMRAQKPKTGMMKMMSGKSKNAPAVSTADAAFTAITASKATPEVTTIGAELYEATASTDMEILYNWSGGFLERNDYSLYGETICLDAKRDYKLDVHGKR